VPDYDVSAEGLASPPNPAFLETYTPAILVKNNGVHEVDVSGTIGIFNLDTGVQVFSAPVTLSGLDAGDTGEARASSSWTPEVIGHYYAYGFVTCDHDGNPSNGQLPPTPFTVSSEPPPPPPPVPAHAPQHEKDGTDKIDVDDLPGKLADPQTPEDHASTHQVGGEDALNVGGLSGQLAQDQPPQTHSNSKHFPVMATAAELEAHEGAGAAHSDALNLANREITGDDAGEVVADQLSPSSEATLTGQDQYRLALLQSTPATMKAVRQWGFPWPTDHAPMHDVGGRDQLTFSPVHTASAQTVIFTPAGGQAIVLSIPFSQAETVAGLIGKLRLSGQLATGVVPGQQLLVGIDYKSGATTKPICQAQIALSQGKVYDFNFDGYAILDPNVQWRGAIDCLLVDIASPSGEAHSIGLPAIFQTPLAAAGSLQIWVWLTVLDVATSGTVLAAAGDVAYPV
jgi:hypothetical protein